MIAARPTATTFAAATVALVLGTCLSGLGCSPQGKVAVATPPNELPPLILPPGVADAGDSRPSVEVVGTREGDPYTRDSPPARVDGGGGGGPVVAAPQPGAYALVIGIEKYRDVPEARGARVDAERFAELMRRTFGVPEKNLRVLVDDRASRSDIQKELRWLQNAVPAGGRVYFFYSGHGAPEPTKGTSFIVPFDGDPAYLQDTAIPMAEIVAGLEKTKAREVVAFADACFSGSGGRSVLAPGTRPLVRVATAEASGRVALFSASRGAEISGPGPNGGGLFSYFVMEALGTGAGDLDGDGQISLKELDTWVSPRVERAARVDNREQHPQLQVGGKLGRSEELMVGWGYAPGER